MPGYFPKDAQILIIGQNPGQLNKRKSGWDDSSYAEETDYQKFQVGYRDGLFESPMGQWLKQGLGTDVVWAFTNVIKCRTPNNSQPSYQEVENCRPWLRRQIRIVQPRVIITLGAFAFSWFELGVGLDRVRGRALPIKLPFFQGVLLPLYHPAYHRYQHSRESRIELFKISTIAQHDRMFNMVMNSQTFTPE